MLYQAYCNKSDIPLSQRLEATVDAIHPTDWPRVVSEIQASGVSLRKISDLVEVSGGTIQGWLDGSVPNYETGIKLIEIHREATGKPKPVKKSPPAKQNKAPLSPIP